MSFKEIVEKIKKKRKENKEKRTSRRLKRRKYRGGSHHLKKDKAPVSNDSKPMPIPVKDKPVDEKPKDPVKDPVKDPEKPKEPEKKPEKPSELTGEDLDNMNEATLLRLLRAVADGIDKGVPTITFDGLLVPANRRVLEVAEERMHKLKGKGEAPKKEEPQKEAPKKEEPAKKVQDGGYDAGVKELAEAKAKTTPAKKV
jgi:hypothetical protein